MNARSLCHKIEALSCRLYHKIHVLKRIAPILTMLLACLLFAGFPSLVSLMSTNSMNGIIGNTKEVMTSGIALFLIILGVMGLYLWTRTDFKHYSKLWMVGLAFVFVSTLGLQALFNYAFS